MTGREAPTRRRWSIEDRTDGVEIVLRPRRTVVRTVIAVLQPVLGFGVCAGLSVLCAGLVYATAALDPARPGDAQGLPFAVGFLFLLLVWMLLLEFRILREARWYFGGAETLRLMDASIEHRIAGFGWSESRVVQVAARPRVAAVEAMNPGVAMMLFHPPLRGRSPSSCLPWRVLPRRHDGPRDWGSWLVVLAPHTTVHFGVDVLVEETAGVMADLQAAAPRFVGEGPWTARVAEGRPGSALPVAESP